MTTVDIQPAKSASPKQLMKHLLIIFAVLGILAVFTGCSKTTPTQIVQVYARGMTFEAPDEIPSGWVTFRFTNESPMLHFAVLERLPDGIHIVDQQSDVAAVFQRGMDLLNQNKPDEAMKAFEALPGWFKDVVFMGGPGFLSPGKTCEATVWIEPGVYLLECYMKTDGVFHSYNPIPGSYGMVHEIRAIETPTESVEPKASIQVEISSESGIQIVNSPRLGTNRIKVVFVDQTVHENFVGHDVHVVRITEDGSIPELEQWINWVNPTGLETPSPFEFLGGLNEMPAGSIGYFTVELDPGDYVWIAEVPNAEKKGMLKRFTVEP